MLLPKQMPKRVSSIIYMLVCALHGLVFGILYAPAQALMFGLSFEATLAWIASGFPFDMTLVGNVCGYCADGAPMPGRFNCSPEMVGKSSYIVNLPRQRDASLILEVNDGSQVVKTFALGEYVKACGYDWTEEDLKDVTVDIDYARTQIRIAVQGWDEVYEFDIVI
jgi:hypothetical protein